MVPNFFLISGPVLLLAIVSAFLVTGEELTIPLYSYESHPLHTLPQFSAMRPSPVVMKKYTHFSTDGSKTTAKSVFAPQKAHYEKMGSDIPFMVGLDVLQITRASRTDSRDNYTEVELNADARVFILLSTPWLNEGNLENINRASIQGLDDQWHSVVALDTVNSRRIFVGRKQHTRGLPRKCVAVERNVLKGEVLTLPHPKRLSINRLGVLDYALVFAQLENATAAAEPRPFPYPASPKTIIRLDNGNKVDVSSDPAVANTKCPGWLHDLHRTPSKDRKTTSEHGEVMGWRTWHAPIDPVYWCYYDHEHGSYPGPYMPALDYTAFKTFDATTSHNRQEESDGGFKVYAIALQSQRKYLIITVHMQASMPRRFFTRHHTAIFAVLNEKWELEMELQMKMDFGAAMATLKTDQNVPMSPAEAAVAREMQYRPYDAFRRFNVLNIEENVVFPESLNMDLRYKTGRPPTAQNKDIVLQGMYENWAGAPNSCAFCKQRDGCGLLIDIRNVATAKRTMKGNVDEEMQWLTGDSLSRVLNFGRDMALGKDFCSFNVFSSTGLPRLQESDGIFYTDPYFAEVHKGPGKNSVRQFISETLQTIVVPRGMLTIADPWSGAYEYAHSKMEKERRIANTEHAILREYN